MAFETNPPHILTASEVIMAADIEERTVFVPQWKGAVRIRSFTKRQADDMRKRSTHKDKYTNKEEIDNAELEALLFCEGVIEPKFEIDDYEKLQDKSAVAISNILKAIMEASGLSDAAITEATKSPTEQSNGSIRVSASQGTRDDTGGTLATDVGI